MKYRVGFLTTHPIQYQAPVFRHLANHSDLDFRVLFCELPDAKSQGEGFGRSFTWDVPLMDGYRYEILRNVSRCPSVSRFSGCDTPELSRRINRANYDVIVVNGWVVKSCLQALWACKRSRIPCVVRGEANNLRPRSWWKRQIQHQLVRQYSACLTIGKANEQFYHSHGVPTDRLFAAPYCVDNNRFSVAARAIDRAAVRHRFGLKDDSPVFLFSGKLINKKHPLELLSAVRMATINGANLQCLFVGDGELRHPCEQYARQHHLSVQFAGFLNQSEIVDAYVAADCLVLPSDHGETWGLVVNEAMACGLPAIVSDQVGCSQDLVTNGQTGQVFPFGDWNKLATTLSEVSTQPHLLKRWGEAAYLRIADYSPQSAASGIVRAVQSVCRQSI